jgi:uncharacterized protein YndB with AHSA1/START domain
MKPKIVEPGPERIRLVVNVPGRPPDEVYSFWVEPEKLRRWWAPEARLDLRAEGTYEYTWPRLQQTLKGRWLRVEPGRSLEFTWTWEHEPEVTKQVRVAFRPAESGTEVEVEHGPYTPSRRDAELRQEHLDGWMYFLGRMSDEAGAARAATS